MGTLPAMTRMSGSAYDISRATGVCSATGAPIGHGETYIAAVVERAGAGEEGLERVDFSVPAWTGGARPARPIFAQWRAVMAPPGERKGQFLDDGALADLFEQTGESAAAGDAARAFRYLLALMLVRRRILRHEGGGGGVMRVRWTGRSGRASEDAPAIEVEEPAMDAEAMGRAAEEVGRLFEGAAGGGS